MASWFLWWNSELEVATYSEVEEIELRGAVGWWVSKCKISKLLALSSTFLILDFQRQTRTGDRVGLAYPVKFQVGRLCHIF